MSVSNPPRPGLRRALTLWDSIAVSVGVVIGCGIFSTPREAAAVGDGILVLIVWVFAGFAAMAGALLFSELASVWPRTGGMYVYLRECFGRTVGFLYGWAQLFVVRPSAVAATALIFAEYAARFFTPSPFNVKLTAIGAIVGVAVVNCLGVRLPSAVRNAETWIKVLALLFIAVVGLSLNGSAHLWELSFEGFAWPPLTVLGAALMVAYWTYDGLSELTDVSGEMQEPRRTIPKAVGAGCLATLVLYLLVNASYLNALSVDGVASTPRLACETVRRAFGDGGSRAIAILIMVSALGSLNGMTLTGPRRLFAMAMDGLFFSWARRVHPRHGTPASTILLQAACAVVLATVWDFVRLIAAFMFVSLIFYGLGAVGVLRVRRMSVSGESRYRTHGYPWTLVFFLTFVGFLLTVTWICAREQAIFGAMVLASGVPAYALLRRNATPTFPS